jgi:DNA mismatch repair protein MutL
MGTIRILPSLIAERIAAGEVVERPASVVKELCENALDAGAQAIEVRLLKGGTELIEVTDNGCGMAREDLEICIGRHATSKIREFEDLSRLRTLGFRGEALPSIASVSELTLTSRAAGTSSTHEIRLAQSAAEKVPSRQVPNLSFLGSSQGTRIRVASLFSQIPARLKFLKSHAAETTAVREIVERLALTHPEVAFHLWSEDRHLLDLPSETLKDRAVRLLSHDNPFEISETELSGSMTIRILWLKGLSLPHTRGMVQIVNGRALRDRTLQSAILNPLKQSFLPGNFPVCVVQLDLPTDELDVNVHPGKTEIRFLEPGKIYALCDAAFHRLLDQDRHIARDPRVPSSFAFSTPWLPHADPLPGTSFLPETSPGMDSPSFVDATPIGDYRGVWFATYLAFEREDRITLIDQHAAHERIRYEQVKRSILGKERCESQQLLVPEVIKMPADRLLTLRSKLEWLDPLGFEAEIFGEEAVLFRSIPSLWGNRALPERLAGLLARLESEATSPSHPAWDETLFEKIAMEACRSSFKAGDRIETPAALDLVRKLYSCEHPGNCPHGRPTSVTLSRNKVEEWFSRLS